MDKKYNSYAVLRLEICIDLTACLSYIFRWNFFRVKNKYCCVIVCMLTFICLHIFFAVRAISKQSQWPWIQWKQSRRSCSSSSSSSKFSTTVGVLYFMSSSLSRPSLPRKTRDGCYSATSVTAAAITASPAGRIFPLTHLSTVILKLI